MVTLSRFTDLHDRFQTEIFTFIVPKTILSDYHSEVQSKDFAYAHQRWFVAFTKTEYHLCGSLHLRTNQSPNVMTCTLDFTLLLHNREHFSRNEIFYAKDAVFTESCPVQASPNFVGLEDLLTRQFTDEQTEFVVDLVMKNPRSVYEDNIKVPIRVKGRPIERLESSYFAFGNLEWNLVMMPTPSGTLIKLNRMTHFEHNCQTKFRLVIGNTNNPKINRFISPVLDSLSDVSGTGESIILNFALEDLVESQHVKVYIEMYSANLISEVIIPGLHQTVHFYDRDKQTWHLQAGTLQKGETEYLKLKLFYGDVKHIPRENARYVGWKVHVRPTNALAATKSEIIGPFCKYYQQRDVDFSFEITTKTPLLPQVPQRRVSNPVAAAEIAPDDPNTFIVLIEWVHHHLLLPSHYHHYDDLHRVQYHQMRLELATVQTENYSLERTLLQYQHGILPNSHPPTHPNESNNERKNSRTVQQVNGSLT